MQVEAIDFKQSPCLSLHRMQHLGIQDPVEVDLRREIYELQKDLRERDEELEEKDQELQKKNEELEKKDQELEEIDEEHLKCKMSKTRYKNAYESFLEILDGMLLIAHNLRYEDDEARELLQNKVEEFAKLKPKYSQKWLEA